MTIRSDTNSYQPPYLIGRARELDTELAVLRRDARSRSAGRCGACSPRAGRNASSLRRSFLPASRSHPPTALLMRSWPSSSSISAIRKGVVELAFADEELGRVDRRATLPEAPGSSELIELVARLVDEVGADHVPRREVDEIRVVDAVVAAQVELEQLARRASGVAFRVACLAMMLQPPARTSCRGLSSSFSISSGDISTNRLVSAKTCPMRTPRKTSPSPYSPSPDLK